MPGLKADQIRLILLCRHRSHFGADCQISGYVWSVCHPTQQTNHSCHLTPLGTTFLSLILFLADSVSHLTSPAGKLPGLPRHLTPHESWRASRSLSRSRLAIPTGPNSFRPTTPFRFLYLQAMCQNAKNKNPHCDPKNAY